MTHADELKTRFNELKERLEAVRSHLEVPHEDGTIVVDAGDLDEDCRGYRELVDKFLQLPSRPEIDDALGSLLVALHTSIDDMAMCCADLKGPLERLISAVYQRLPHDPQYADDAS